MLYGQYNSQVFLLGHAVVLFCLRHRLDVVCYRLIRLVQILLRQYSTDSYVAGFGKQVERQVKFRVDEHQQGSQGLSEVMEPRVLFRLTREG